MTGVRGLSFASLLGTARELTVLVDRGSFSAEMNTTHTHTLSLSIKLSTCSSRCYLSPVHLSTIKLVLVKYIGLYMILHTMLLLERKGMGREIESRSFESKNDMTKFVGRAIALGRKKNTCKKRFKKLTSFEERGKRPVCIRSSCLFVRVVKDHTILLLRHVGWTFVQVVGLLLRYSRSCCRIRSLRRFVIGIRLDGTG